MNATLLRGLIGAAIGLLLTAVFLALRSAPRDQSAIQWPPKLTQGGGGSSTSGGGNLTESERVMADIVAKHLQDCPLDTSTTSKTIEKLKKLPRRERILPAAIRTLVGKPSRSGVEELIPGDDPFGGPKQEQPPKEQPLKNQLPKKDQPSKERLDLWVKVAELIDSPAQKGAALYSIAEMQRGVGDPKGSDATLAAAQAILERELAKEPPPSPAQRASVLTAQPVVQDKDQSWFSWLVWGGVVSFVASTLSKPTLEGMGVSLKDWLLKVYKEAKESADQKQRAEDEKAGIAPTTPTEEKVLQGLQ